MARRGDIGDVADVHALLHAHVADGALLPRTLAEVERDIEDYVVVTDRGGRLLACASLIEYSPSLAEVGAVAVDPARQGKGLGTLAVRSVETVARRRGFTVLFAMSRAVRFFESLGYRETSLARFPEKVARYGELRERGIQISEKPCLEKRLA